jgi:hypothetical protein
MLAANNGIDGNMRKLTNLKEGAKICLSSSQRLLDASEALFLLKQLPNLLLSRANMLGRIS